MGGDYYYDHFAEDFRLVDLRCPLDLLWSLMMNVIFICLQGFLFLLCALCAEDVSKVRVGKLSPQAIQTLRLLKDFLGVQFNIKPDPATVAELSF